MTPWQQHAARLERLAMDAGKLADDADEICKLNPCECGGTCQRCISLAGIVQRLDEAKRNAKEEAGLAARAFAEDAA